jgi:hypothetical protein
MPVNTFDLYQQPHSLRVELKELKYLLLVTSISNGKEGEDKAIFREPAGPDQRCIKIPI